MSHSNPVTLLPGYRMAVICGGLNCLRVLDGRPVGRREAGRAVGEWVARRRGRRMRGQAAAVAVAGWDGGEAGGGWGGKIEMYRWVIRALN